MNIWKIIIWIFAGIAVAACLLELFIPPHPDKPTFADEMFLQSQAMQLELTSETGRGWHRAIREANSGKPDAIIARTGQAIFTGNYNAACAAAQLLENDRLRDHLYMEIANAAVEECSTVPYAFVASRDMQPGEVRDRLIERVNTRQRICRGIGK